MHRVFHQEDARMRERGNGIYCMVQLVQSFDVQSHVLTWGQLMGRRKLLDIFSRLSLLLLLILSLYNI